MSALPARVAVSREVLVQPLDEEAIMLDLQSGCYFSLDDVAMRIWQLLDEQGDVGEVERVVTRLLQEYTVPEATLRQDLADLLAQWAAAGLATVEP